jgi:CRP-like cAMP-binding protein
MIRRFGDINVANCILLALPPATWERMKARLEPVDLEQGKPILVAGAPVKHLYFINRGLVSLVKNMEDGRSVEIGAVGIEGVAGLGALYGIESAILDSIVQIDGNAFRIDRHSLQGELSRSKAFRELLQRSHYVAVSQFSQTAACNRLHSLRKRFCRWLLIAHDSAWSDSFEITHEFLALMLGVQRVRVSIMANTLQKAGMIRYNRGQITVVDRSALENSACECYRAIQTQLDQLFGITRSGKKSSAASEVLQTIQRHHR